MAVDPLGLVYSGADGTGAAFKAPWTSYDPYQAELTKGANIAKIAEEKGKIEQKQKEKVLGGVKIGPVPLFDFAVVGQNMVDNESQYISELMADGKFSDAQNASVKISSLNKSYEAITKGLYNSITRTQQTTRNLPGAYRDEVDQNLAILVNPELASPDTYPDVYNTYQEDLKMSRELFKNDPWMNEEAIKAQAKLSTAQKYVNQLTEVPRDYPEDKWLGDMYASAYKEKKKKGEVKGNLNIDQITLDEPEAKKITQDKYEGDYQLRNQMKRNFNALTDGEKAKYGDPKNYFTEKYYPRLLKADYDESKRSQQVFMSGTSTYNTQQDGGDGYVIPVGFTSTTTGQTQTNLRPYATVTSLNQIGVNGDLGKTNVNTFYRYDKTDEFGVMKPNTAILSGSFALGNILDVPVVSTEIPLKFKDGTIVIIPKGSIITERVIEIMKNEGYKIPRGYVKWDKMIENVVTTPDEEVVGLTPLRVHEANITNQLRAKKQTYQRPSLPTEDVYEYYGIPVKTSSGGGGESPNSPPPNKPATTTTTTMPKGNVR
jgi:hypothetical protein